MAGALPPAARQFRLRARRAVRSVRVRREERPARGRPAPAAWRAGHRGGRSRRRGWRRHRGRSRNRDGGAVVTTPRGQGTAEEREAEEALFYHEADLNAAWTGARLAMGGLSFLFGAFAFAYFYLRSLNSNHLWTPPGVKPHLWAGTLI